MLSAIRRTKSLPAWLAMIAIFTVVATLATVIVSSLIQARRTAPDSAPLSTSARAVPADPASARVDASLGGRSTQSPDALAVQASQSALTSASNVAAPAAEAAAPASGTAASTVPGTAPGTASLAANPIDGASDVLASANATDTTVAKAADDASSVAAQHTAQSHTAAARAARRHAAEEAARTSRSLRADIARYNADRAAGFERNQKMVPLRQAQVPSIHSLWDDVPSPISNIYRN